MWYSLHYMYIHWMSVPLNDIPAVSFIPQKESIDHIKL